MISVANLEGNSSPLFCSLSLFLLTQNAELTTSQPSVFVSMMRRYIYVSIYLHLFRFILRRLPLDPAALDMQIESLWHPSLWPIHLLFIFPLSSFCNAPLVMFMKKQKQHAPNELLLSQEEERRNSRQRRASPMPRGEMVIWLASYNLSCNSSFCVECLLCHGKCYISGLLKL